MALDVLEQQRGTAEGEIDDAKVLAAVEEAGYSAVRV